MTKQPKSTPNQDGYNAWSAFYDQYPNPTIAMDEAGFPMTWQHVSNRKVLEIGCGTGRHTKKLLDLKNDVTGIDLSKGMLSVARQRLSDKKINLIEADFMTYEGFEKNSFDAIVVSLVIEHFSDLNQFFKKVADVLKPEGELFISEIHPSRAEQGILAHFKNQNGDEINLTSFVHSEEDVAKAASAAGLAMTESKDILGSQDLEKLKPEWVRHLGKPMVKIWVFKK